MFENVVSQLSRGLAKTRKSRSSHVAPRHLRFESLEGRRVLSATLGSLKLLSPLPTTVVAGQVEKFTLIAYDTTGTQMTGNNGTAAYTGVVDFSSTLKTSIGGTSYQFTTFDAGSHTFSVTFKTAGTCTVTATDLATNIFTTSNTVTVTPGAVAKYSISASSSVTATVPTTVSVKAEDAEGNLVPNYTGTVKFTSSDGAASLPVPYTFLSTDKGAHTFTNGVTFKTAGTQSLTVTDSVNAAATTTKSGITVLAAPVATSFKFLTSSDINEVGAPEKYKVEVLDQYGKVFKGYTGTVHFSILNNDAGASLPADTPFLSSWAGAHTFTFTFKALGAQTLNVWDTLTTSIKGSVGFTIAAAPTFTVTGLVSGQSVLHGTSIPLTIQAVNGNGSAYTSYPDTVFLQSNDPGTTYGPVTSLGSGKFSTSVNFATAGKYDLYISDPNATWIVVKITVTVL